MGFYLVIGGIALLCAVMNSGEEIVEFFVALLRILTHRVTLLALIWFAATVILFSIVWWLGALWMLGWFVWLLN